MDNTFEQPQPYSINSNKDKWNLLQKIASESVNQPCQGDSFKLEINGIYKDGVWGVIPVEDNQIQEHHELVASA
jgi:hypothetical protein